MKYKFSFSDAVYIILYLIGLIFWYKFLNISSPIIGVNDWVNSNLHLDTIRNGLQNASMPWMPNISYGNNKYFLANPEIVTTPDIFLIKYLTNSLFIYIHTIILYSFGFYSLLFCCFITICITIFIILLVYSFITFLLAFVLFFWL
jgi:hypothetical protein